MLKIFILSAALVSLCLLGVMLNVTTPATVGPFGILVIFIFGYALSLGVVTFLVYWLSIAFARLSVLFLPKMPRKPLSFVHAYYYSTILASVPVLLVGLQSIGSIGIYEFTLVVFFVIAGWIYVSKKVA